MASAAVSPAWPVMMIGRRPTPRCSKYIPSTVATTETTPLLMVATKAACVSNPVAIRTEGAKYMMLLTPVVCDRNAIAIPKKTSLRIHGVLRSRTLPFPILASLAILL